MTEAWPGFYSPDFPVGWRIPSELGRPASSPVGNLVILALSRNIVGNDVVEALGLYLAADVRFNVWYGLGAGGNRSAREKAEIRVARLETLRHVYEAWKLADACFDTGDRARFDELHSALLQEVRTAIEETCNRMDETVADFGDL